MLIAAHGNSLRALVKILDNVPEERKFSRLKILGMCYHSFLWYLVPRYLVRHSKVSQKGFLFQRKRPRPSELFPSPNRCTKRIFFCTGQDRWPQHPHWGETLGRSVGWLLLKGKTSPSLFGRDNYFFWVGESNHQPLGISYQELSELLITLPLLG